MIATLHTRDDTSVLSFCSLRRLSHTYLHPLTFWASRTFAVTGPTSCGAQSALPKHCHDTDGKVFYGIVQGEYTTGLHSRQSRQLPAIYGLSVAGFCQGSEPHLAWVPVVEDPPSFQVTHHLWQPLRVPFV